MLGFSGKRRIAGIADRDQHVAHEPDAAGALHRRFGEQRAERRVIEPRKIGEPRRAQFLSGHELRLAGGFGEFVPGTHREAIVAAEDAVADGRTQLARDRPFVLDRQIGDAASRIEPVRRRERGGRTNIEAGTAAAAMIGFRRVRLQLERGEDRAEEQPGAELERYEVGVLALPAQSSGGGERLFHHGCGIDEHFRLAAECLDERTADALELRFDELVIILALRISGNGTAFPRFENRQRIPVGAVIEPEHDDGAHFGPQRPRVAAALGRRLHPGHVAVQALGEELRQPGLRPGDRVGPHDAGDLEAVRAGKLADRPLAVRRIAQKSRLA